MVLPDQCTDVIREQAVETDAFESEFGMTAREVPPPILTKSHQRVITANRVFPEVRKGENWIGVVAAEVDQCQEVPQAIAVTVLCTASASVG